MSWVCVCVFINNERERDWMRIDWRVIEMITNWNWQMSEWLKIVFKNTNPFSFLFFFFVCSSPPHPYILIPHKTFNISLMLSTPVIMRVIVMMVIVVSGDDTQALRHTISSLCTSNTVGQFASCCKSYDNGASITLEDSTARSCFIYSLASTTGSVLTSLFVICFIFVLFLFDDCRCFSSFFIFRSFQSKDLRAIKKDTFSGLTSLQYLFSLLTFCSFFLFSLSDVLIATASQLL